MQTDYELTLQFLPAVWCIVGCGELGGVWALRPGPDETGEGTDSSVNIEMEVQQQNMATVYKTCSKI